MLFFLESLSMSQKSVPLQCVFHSIRFKVNKGWSSAELLFLCPYAKGCLFFFSSGIRFFRKPRVENRVMFPQFLCFPSAKRMFPPCEPYVLRCGTVCFSQRKRKKFLLVRVKIPFRLPYSVFSSRLCCYFFSLS